MKLRILLYREIGYSSNDEIRVTAGNKSMQPIDKLSDIHVELLSKNSNFCVHFVPVGIIREYKYFDNVRYSMH